METSLTNDYYLQFNDTYFVSHGNAKKDVTHCNDLDVKNNKINLLGRKLYKGILKTIGDILIVGLLLGVCKYAGLYDLWVQLADKMV